MVRLGRLPEPALEAVFSACEGADLARLGCAAPFWRCEAAGYAESLARARGWRPGDGLGHVERLATETCAFDYETFRAVGGGGTSRPRLRSARCRGSGEVARVLRPGNGAPPRAAAVFSEHGSRMYVVEPGRYRVAARSEPRVPAPEDRGGLAAERARTDL